MARSKRPLLRRVVKAYRERLLLRNTRTPVNLIVLL